MVKGELLEDNIQKKLAEIEQKEHVTIIMAVESGSRAWGFASPDSDYDVRFLYVRTLDEYLKLKEPRDVIEWQLDEVLDINGWDLRKALRLLYQSNPTIFEWASSPIRYRNSALADEFRKLLPEYFSCKKSVYHYWHTASSTYRDHLMTPEVKVKKYFYAIRPLLAAQWIIDKKCAPPMKFEELADAELKKELIPEIRKLLALKRVTPEIGTAPGIPVWNDFIEQELQRIKHAADEMEECGHSWDHLDAFFNKTVKK